MKFTDFKKNISQYQKPKSTVYSLMSGEQIEFLLMCRDSGKPIPFTKMAELWEELGWGRSATEIIRKRYLYAKSNRTKHIKRTK